MGGQQDSATPTAAEIREVCAAYSDCIDAIELDLFDWSSRREKLDKAFDRAVREGGEVAAELPDGWELKAKAQFLFGRVMGSETLARRFAKSVRENHPRHTQTLAYMASPEDFDCFAGLLDSALFDTGGLEAVMGCYPVSSRGAYGAGRGEDTRHSFSRNRVR